jgi:hypothetical protein
MVLSIYEGLLRCPTSKRGNPYLLCSRWLSFDRAIKSDGEDFGSSVQRVEMQPNARLDACESAGLVPARIVTILSRSYGRISAPRSVYVSVNPLVPYEEPVTVAGSDGRRNTLQSVVLMVLFRKD